MIHNGYTKALNSAKVNKELMDRKHLGKRSFTIPEDIVLNKRTVKGIIGYRDIILLSLALRNKIILLLKT